MALETETLDKLFLEISQFTSAKTAREIRVAKAFSDLLDDVRAFISDHDNGLGPKIARLRDAAERADEASAS